MQSNCSKIYQDSFWAYKCYAVVMNEENVINPPDIGVHMWVLLPTLVKSSYESLVLYCLSVLRATKKDTDIN